jgi:hypothetical protein
MRVLIEAVHGAPSVREPIGCPARADAIASLVVKAAIRTNL